MYLTLIKFPTVGGFLSFVRGDLSRSKLAARTGVDGSTIYKIETGRQSPKQTTLVCLFRALGLTEEEISAAICYYSNTSVAGAVAPAKEDDHEEECPNGYVYFEDAFDAHEVAANNRDLVNAAIAVSAMRYHADRRTSPRPASEGKPSRIMTGSQSVNLARALTSQGNIYVEVGEFELAMTCLDEAISIFETKCNTKELPDRHAYHRAVTSAVYVSNYLGRPAVASVAVVNFVLTDDPSPRGAAYCAFLLVQSFLRWGKYHRALEHLKDAERRYQELHKDGFPQAERYLMALRIFGAQALAGIGEKDVAMKHLEEVRDELGRSEPQFADVFVHTLIAEAGIQEDEALLRRALEEATARGVGRYRVMLTRFFARFRRVSGALVTVLLVLLEYTNNSEFTGGL